MNKEPVLLALEEAIASAKEARRLAKEALADFEQADSECDDSRPSEEEKALYDAVIAREAARADLAKARRAVRMAAIKAWEERHEKMNRAGLDF